MWTKFVRQIGEALQMTSYRIGSGDPGRFKNSFAFVLTEYDRLKNKIYVKGARDWMGEEYPTVEKELAKVHQDKALDFFVVEQNNTGIHVIESLRTIHHVPVIGINSSSKITDPAKIRAGKSMDRVEHVGWINEKRAEGTIVFPKVKTAGLKKLVNQLNTFVRKTTKGGQTTYAAEGSQPDDYVMAFMVNTFFIRRKLMKDLKVKRIVLNKKYSDSYKQDLGSGIPTGSILTGRDILYPQGVTNTRKYRIR